MSSTPKLTVYEPLGKDRLSLYAWRMMVSELAEYRELIGQLVKRNVAAQFRQSFLGYLWIALPPIATTLVFGLLRQSNIINVPESQLPKAMPYALFALTGVTIWGFFTQLVMQCTNSLASADHLVSRIYFPREILVLSAAGAAVVNMIIRLAVLLITFALFAYIPPLQALFGLVLLIPLAALAIGISLFLAPINAIMHDTGRMLEFAFQFGMFLAPTVYPTPSLETAMAGSAWQQGLYWLHNLNPITHFIHAINDLISTGTMHVDNGLMVSMGLSFLVLAMGWRFFHICEPLFAERL